MRKLNLIFLAALLVLVSALGVGTYFLHEYQVDHNAEALLKIARKAEEDGKKDKAAGTLGHYLNLRKSDGERYKWYARVLDELYAEAPARRGLVLDVHQEALRLNPGDAQLERKCADLAMSLGSHRLADAQTHLIALYEKYLTKATEPGKDGIDPERAEIEEMLAECNTRLTKFKDAEESYEKAIHHDPTRLSAYMKLAELRRNNLRQEAEAANKTIDEMLERNPSSGLAYLNRYGYYRQFPPPPKGIDPAGDLTTAVRLAPDDADVLLTAASNALEDKKPDEARPLVEKGLKLHPENSRFAILLAVIEIQEQHLDRAEAILRKAYEAKPETILAYHLARVLILEKKFEGPDQAERYIEVLRSRGLGDSYVRLLHGLMYMEDSSWPQAITEIEGAQSILKSADPATSAQLTSMLALCYRRTGRNEQRLAALQSLAGAPGRGVSETSQLQLAQELMKSGGPGELEQALRILESLAETRPELEIDIARLLIGRTLLKPKAERDWRAVDRQIERAEKMLASKKSPATDEAFILLHALAMEAKGKPDEAVKLLTAAAARDAKNPRYTIRLAQLAMAQGDKNGEALKILDEAEKHQGRTRELRLARLSYWAAKGGPGAKAEVAKIAEEINQAPAAEKLAYLEQLAATERRIGEAELARQHLAELTAAAPKDLPLLATLVNWTLEAAQGAEVNDKARADALRNEAKSLIDRMRKLENPEVDLASAKAALSEKALKGTYWRLAQATYLLFDEAGRPQGLKKNEEAIEKARQYAEEIIAERPQWWGGPLLQARIAELNPRPDENPEEIIASLQRAIELGYTGPEAPRTLIGLLISQNRYDDLDRLVERLRSQTSAAVDLRLPLLAGALRKKDYKRAIPLAQELFENSPRWVDHVNLGKCFMQAARAPGASEKPLEAAGEQFRKAVQLGRGVPDPWITYVRYLATTGKLEEARNQVEEARKALPSDRVNLALAECLMVVGESAQAGALVEPALKAKPDDPATLQLAAIYYLTQGRTAEGMNCLETLLSPAPGAKATDLAWANRFKAQVLLKSGRREDVEMARELIKGNLRNRPSSVPDRLVHAKILAGQPKPDDHLQGIADLEKLDESGDLDANDQFLLAQYYTIEKKDDQKYQDEMLKILVDNKSTNPQHLASYVAFLIGRKKLDEAGRWLGELTKVDKQGTLSLAMEAALLRARNPEVASLPELRELLIGRVKKAPELIYPVAALLASYGFPADAEAAYKEYIKRDPTKPERLLALAGFLGGQTGRTVEALEILARAWKVCPPEQVAVVALPLYNSPSTTEPQRKQIEAWLAEACRKRPDQFVLSNKLAALWILQGRFDEAEDLYRKILDSHPDSSDALNNLAWLLALRSPDKADEAVKLINHAIELRGPTASLIDTKAVVLIRAKKLKEARDALDDARKIDKKNYSVALHLAWALRDEGKKDEAKKEFQEAVKLGWKADRSDPLERRLIDELRQELGL